MAALLVGQCVVLLGVVLAFAAAAPRSRLDVAMRIVAAVAVLAALARVGLWLFPPWWTPAATGLAVLILVVVRYRMAAPLPLWPSGGPQWAAAVVMAAMVGAAAVVLLKAAERPHGPVVDLASPLPPGRYLVANGGAWTTINAHRETVGSPDPRFLPWRGNGWAVDIVAIDRLGRRVSGVLPRDPALYRSFGVPVLAPCSGHVVAAVDGFPDMPVPEYDRTNLAGNHVIFACDDDVHVVLAHLRRGSVLVRAGEVVEAGSPLGRIGNSGGTEEPHLHLHVQRPGPVGVPMGGDPVPLTLDGRFLVRGNRLIVEGGT